MDVPEALQPGDVSGVDLDERRVALIRDRATVRDPVCSGQARELSGRKGRRGGRATGAAASACAPGGDEGGSGYETDQYGGEGSHPGLFLSIRRVRGQPVDDRPSSRAHETKSPVRLETQRSEFEISR